MIPNKREARSSKLAKENHGPYINMFGNNPSKFNDIVHRAAYWGNRSDFIEDKPKIDSDSRLFDPTIVLQYLMLLKFKYM